MNRYVKYIIEDLRRSTDNEEFSNSIGIPDIDFLRYLNDGQKRIYSLISNAHPQVFQVTKDCPIAAGEDTITLPFDVHLGNKISDVKYRTLTGDQNFSCRLTPTYLSQLTSNYRGYPSEYYRSSGKLRVYPRSQNSGTLTLTYIKSVPDLALRAATITGVTIVDRVITSLTVNVLTDEIDIDELNKVTRICIADDEGNITAANIRITGVDETTGIITVSSSHLLEDDETIAVGDFIIPGKHATTHSDLDPIIERYLMSYCSVKIMQQEGSNETGEELATLSTLEQDIVDSYSDITDDIIEIPNIVTHDDDWY